MRRHSQADGATLRCEMVLLLLRDALRAIPNFPGVTLFKAEGFTAAAAVEKHSVKMR